MAAALLNVNSWMTESGASLGQRGYGILFYLFGGSSGGVCFDQNRNPL